MTKERIQSISNRNVSFDMMKGLGILFVIIGHMAHGYGLFPIIYVFHMPLFFIVSGYFYKPKPMSVLLKRDFRLLLLPFSLVVFLMLVYGAIMALLRHDTSKFTYWLDCVIYLIFPWNYVPGHGIGPLWFLLAMFWCRMGYNLFNIFVVNKIVKRRVMYLVVMVSLVFFVTVRYVPLDYNVCCILVGFSAMFFYMIGLLAKYYNFNVGKLWSILFVLVGLICVYYSMGGVSMAGMEYNLILVNVIAATSVTYLIYWVCRRMEETKFGMLLAWLGRLSIAAFCIHSLMFRILPLDRFVIMFAPQADDLVIHGVVTLLHVVISFYFCMIVERMRIMRVIFGLEK